MEGPRGPKESLTRQAKGYEMSSQTWLCQKEPCWVATYCTRYSKARGWLLIAQANEGGGGGERRHDMPTEEPIFSSLASPPSPTENDCFIRG